MSNNTYTITEELHTKLLNFITLQYVADVDSINIYDEDADEVLNLGDIIRDIQQSM